MKVLCSFPGRYGDLIWALPSIRALSRRLGHPVDLQIAGEFGSIAPLLQQQPYLGVIHIDERWGLTPAQAWEAPPLEMEGYDLVLHLGYRGWPTRPLPYETLANLNAQLPQFPPELGLRLEIQPEELHLDEPWIQIAGAYPPTELAVGFTEAHFELKLGLLASLDRYLPPYLQLTPPGSRWTTEGRGLVSVQAGDWLMHAGTIRNSDLVLADCSALHVLGAAMGKRVVVMEPMEARWNPVFWPLEMDGPQVWCVKGNDGRPTWDARHTRDLIELVMGQTQ
jgi:hypothetical protein